MCLTFTDQSSTAQIMTQRGILGSPEWTIGIGQKQRADGRVLYYADVFRVGAFVVRIFLPHPVENKIAAEVALTDQVRKWVSAYETKEHTGGTDFGDLSSL